uniref:Immunoglobulin V-set domain-containing protein n=1 Tax=Anolis carolinensis TaxID=28377 RepID=A0A803T538_ANOCA
EEPPKGGGRGPGVRNERHGVSRREGVKENITIKIKQKPPSVQVGDSVALIPEGSQRNLSSCRWFRGDRDRFFEIVEFMPFNNSVDYKEAYSGRESIDLYCELHIRNLSLWDSNFYRIEKITSNNTREAGETALLVQGKESGRVSLSPFPPNLLLLWGLGLMRIAQEMRAGEPCKSPPQVPFLVIAHARPPF